MSLYHVSEMTMEPQSLMNLAVWAVLVVLGWLAREMWAAVKALQQNQHQIEIDMANLYVKREEFTAGIREIKEMCEKIFDKIDALNDRKADK